MTKDKPQAVVVTGASAGRATVRAFASRGAHRGRRQAFGGAPTVAAVRGSKPASPLLDDRRARSGFESRQDKRAGPDRSAAAGARPFFAARRRTADMKA